MSKLHPTQRRKDSIMTTAEQQFLNESQREGEVYAGVKSMKTAKQAFLSSILKKGELYAGIILCKNGEPDHHLILLPGEAESVNWEDAKKFAVKAGGELPTLREQSLLYANLKEEFQERYYWSCESHATDSDYAWFQYFGYGNQDHFNIYSTFRARAVRRLVIL